MSTAQGTLVLAKTPPARSRTAKIIFGHSPRDIAATLAEIVLFFLAQAAFVVFCVAI